MCLTYDKDYVTINFNLGLFEDRWAQTKEKWEQHNNFINNSIIDICNNELSNFENVSHLSTPGSKRRKRRFTCAQNAIRTLLKKASANKKLPNGSLKKNKRLTKKAIFQEETVNNCSAEKNENKVHQAETLECAIILDRLPLEDAKLRDTQFFSLISEDSPDLGINKKDEINKINPDQELQKNENHTPDPADDGWLTDDESDGEIKPSKGPSDINGKKTVKETNKKKRKATQYFTPSIPYKSTRLTRAQSRLEASPMTENPTASILATPKNSSNPVRKSARVLANLLAPSTHSSGTSTSSLPTAASGKSQNSAGRTKKVVSRVTNTPDTKTLTASAAKRRQEEEAKRRLQLMQLQEKEEKAFLQKQAKLKERQMESKLKNEEKRKKIEMAKELKEREMEERRQKELEKQEEMEKRRREKEEVRKLDQIKHQKMLQKRQKEFELRKQQEEEERKAKLQRQEELIRKKQEEAERHKLEQEKIVTMIQQHNNSLQKGNIPPKPAMANVLLKPTQTTTTNIPLAPVSAQESPQEIVPENNENIPLNKTFVLNGEHKPQDIIIKELQSYPLTPPPRSPKKPPMPVNYDISDIRSDDDTDDEKEPKKPIPSWAKGEQFIKTLTEQYGKSKKRREKEINEIFPKVVLPVDLGKIFPDSQLHPRYAKRTSSAVWSSPPNISLNLSRSVSDISFHD